MKIVYSNISGGLIFAGKTYGEMLFSKISLENYIDYFTKKDADIICLDEVHLEDKTSSTMVERIAKECSMPYYTSLALHASHLDTSKQQGLAIMSRYPIIHQEEMLVKSPELEIIRPNGDHWRLFDKGAQKVIVEVNGKPVTIVNLSYFPFHHFNRRLDEEEFSEARKQFIDSILDTENDYPIIVVGDFNNKNVPLDNGFPELFANNLFEKAVAVKSTVVGCDDQLDHILYQPKFYKASNQFSELNGSDHLAIGAELKPI